MNVGEVLSSLFQLLSGRLARQIEQNPEFRREILTALRKLVGHIEELERKDQTAKRVDPQLSRKLEELCSVGLAGDKNWTSAEERYSLAPEQNKVEKERVSDDELRLIQERCNLKTKAVRWCITRRFHSTDAMTEEIDAQRRELINQARNLPDCYLWMLYVPDSPAAEDKSAFECWENLAECLENLAHVTELLQAVLPYREEQRDLLEKTVKYTAEAQSALRVAVSDVGNRQPDPDQEKCFWWLRRTTEEQRIFVERYMRWNDPADASAWEDLRNRIRALNREFHERLQLDHQVPKLLNRARFHVKMIESGQDHPERHDWRVIAECVTQLMELGIKPSHTSMRELLYPIRDQAEEQPVDIYQAIYPVISEICRYESLEIAASEGTYAGKLNEDVRTVASLLQGQKIVMLGGTPQASARQMLIAAFRLQDLIWIDSRAHESVEHFRDYIYQPRIAAFLLLIRWCSHSFAALEEDCKKVGVPFIRITGGYSPNQVAYQILSQAGDKLRAQPPGSPE